MTAMIEVEHLSKLFGPVMAVKDVTFGVSKGEILGFLGPNGAGKTTTMRILTGFFPPTSGRARIDGLDVFEDSLAVRGKIGYLPENVPLYGDMIVSDYLHFVAEVKGLSRAERKRGVGQAIEACSLQQVENRAIKRISKGYRQRVGLAQALVGDPELLILDEPTIGLDPRQIAEIRRLIKSFAGEKTVILSTHILPEVSMTCERVAIIQDGRIKAEGTPEELSAELSGTRRVKLRLNGPEAEVKTRLARAPGVLHVDGGGQDNTYTVETEPGDPALAGLAAAVHESGWDLYELTPMTATLEDVFIDLVTQEDQAEMSEPPEDAVDE